MNKRRIMMVSAAVVIVVIASVVLTAVTDEVDWPARLDPNGVQIKQSCTQPIEPVKKPWPELPIVDGPTLTTIPVGVDEIRLPKDAYRYVVSVDSWESYLGVWMNPSKCGIAIRIRSRTRVFRPLFDLYEPLYDQGSEDGSDSLIDLVEEYEKQTDEAIFLRAIKSTYAMFRAHPYDYVQTMIAYRGLSYRELEALDDGIEAYLYADDDVHVYSFGPRKRRDKWLMVVFRATGEYLGEVIVWEDEHYTLALAMARTMNVTRKQCRRLGTCAHVLSWYQ